MVAQNRVLVVLPVVCGGLSLSSCPLRWYLVAQIRVLVALMLLPGPSALCGPALWPRGGGGDVSGGLIGWGG